MKSLRTVGIYLVTWAVVLLVLCGSNAMAWRAGAVFRETVRYTGEYYLLMVIAILLAAIAGLILTIPLIWKKLPHGGLSFNWRVLCLFSVPSLVLIMMHSPYVASLPGMALSTLLGPPNLVSLHMTIAFSELGRHSNIGAVLLGIAFGLALVVKKD